MQLSFGLNTLSEDFSLKKSAQYGETLVLVTPNNIACKWTEDNLIFRSSIWTEDGFLVSPSFPKFFNWGEKDNLIPPPESLIGTTAVEKIDGSALIVSYFHGKTIIRTRGTFTVKVFENSVEIDWLREKYPKAFDYNLGGDSVYDDNFTYIYEWYSPKNKIVLDLGDVPRLFLIGGIFHDDYSLASQSFLDAAAKELGVERPPTYVFDSVEDLLSKVKAFDGKEGICLYYNRGQHIKKIKGSKYLAIHAFKHDLSINNLLEAYVLCGRPDYNTFYAYISDTYDYECAEIARGSISKLVDANKEVNKILDHMQKFADGVRPLPRKEAAIKILGAYGKTSRSGYVFTLLDNKSLDDDAYKKLLHQVIPK
jgi:hypothetical protein